MGNEWALADDAWKDGADPHIGGTIPRSGGRLEFWLSAPRPKKYTVDEWDKICQEKWDRIFHKDGKV